MTQDTMQEEPRKKKVDITSKVVGKIEEDQINFYVDERNIGYMSMSSANQEYNFIDGFGLEDNKIYQIQTVGVEDEQYVEGCDMGWC